MRQANSAVSRRSSFQRRAPRAGLADSDRGAVVFRHEVGRSCRVPDGSFRPGAAGQHVDGHSSHRGRSSLVRGGERRRGCAAGFGRDQFCDPTDLDGHSDSGGCGVLQCRGGSGGARDGAGGGGRGSGFRPGGVLFGGRKFSRGERLGSLGGRGEPAGTRSASSPEGVGIPGWGGPGAIGFGQTALGFTLPSAGFDSILRGLFPVAAGPGSRRCRCHHGRRTYP